VNFPSVKELADFLKNMYGEGRSAAIALVSVRFPGSSRKGVRKNTSDHEQAEFAYQPFCLKATDTSASFILPEIQIEGENINENVKSLEEDDGVSAYVMLIGGGT
jgi:predicted secreted protein